MPRKKDIDTANKPDTEENIISFVPQSNKVFNGFYTREQWLADGLPADEFAVFHERQEELLPKLAQDSDVVNLFSQMMLKHNEFVKKEGWQMHDPFLVSFDLSTTALVGFMGYLQGYDFTTLSRCLHEDIRKRSSVYTLFPQSLPLNHNYHENNLMRAMLFWALSFRALDEFAFNKSAANKAMPTVLESLKYLQGWHYGSECEYRGSMMHPLGPEFHTTFTTPRFSTIWLTLLELDPRYQTPPESVEVDTSYLPVRFTDTTNMRDMVYFLKKEDANITTGLPLIIEALKRNGLDLRYTLFSCTGMRDQAQEAAAVFAKAGTNYLLHIPSDEFPRGKLPAMTKMQKEFANCHSAFKRLSDVWSKTSIDLSHAEVDADADSGIVTFVSSIDLDNTEDANKLACALGEGPLSSINDKVDMMLDEACAFFPMDEVFSQVEHMMLEPSGFIQIREAFHSFVLKSMKAEKSANKAQYTQAVTPKGVKEVLKNDDHFLHFFTLYCQQKLAQNKSK